MSKGIGRQIQFGIAKETTRGTAISSAAFWIPWKDFSMDEKQDRAVKDQSMGVIEGSIGEDLVKQWAEGSLTAPIADKHFPLILLALCGTLATTTNADASTNVKDHTITVAQSVQHQSLTLFVDDPVGGQDYKHALGVVKTLEITYAQGSHIQYKLELKAKKGATATNTPAVTTENKFLPQHLTFKLATTQAGLTAASAVVIKSASIKFDPNSDDDTSLGSADPTDFINKEFTVSGSIEATWQNETDFRNAGIALTQQAMRIDLINTDVTIGTAANPELKIDFHAVVFKPITRAFKLGDLIVQSFDFTAHYNTTDSKMLTIVATNLQTSY